MSVVCIGEFFWMTTFIALYRGRTIHEAELIAVSINAKLVGQVAAALLAETPVTGDEILDSVNFGREKALKRIAGTEYGDMPHATKVVKSISSHESA
jgi:hypothetical protein